jgi:UDP-N-acetylglucosamine:LPS N-acetylglucosamine transferase
MVQESEIKEKFRKELLGLVDNPDRLAEMREKIKRLSHQDASDVIAKSVLRIAANA